MPHAITKDEVKEVDAEALQGKLSALRADLRPAHMSLTLASMETVSAELRRRRTQTPETSENCWL
jgi:hypothetical protein